MFHRSFFHLTRASSLSCSVKLANGQWLKSGGQQAKSFSRSSTSSQVVDQNDRSDRVYELKHYETGQPNDQLDRSDGMENWQKQNWPLRRRHYPMGLTNDRRNQLARLRRSNRQDTGLDIVLDPNSTVVERDFIKSIQPELPPTFNLATYANHLDIIKHLVKLGVNIQRLERDREVAKYLITLDFEKHVMPYLHFLVRCGLRRDDLGNFLTENFKVLQENLENLQKRYDYYRKMKFSKKQITEMMLVYPKLINYPIDIVDAKLGYLQRYLKLKPVFVRQMLYNCPAILKTDRVHLEYTKFALVEQCGFRNYQLKQILINNPSVILKENARVAGSFGYICEHITKDLDLICKFPDVLCVNVKTLEERDQYLKKLGRAQYDPLKPLYVPLSAFLIEDDEFLTQFAKADPEDMNKFLKTL